MQKNSENTYVTLKEIGDKYNLSIPAELKRVEEKYPILIPKYYFDLIDRNNIPNDPIWKQCIPDKKELEDSTSSEDPFWEEKQMPVPQLIHRYQDRAVVLTTNRCSMQCRFCFRKRYWKSEIKRQDITDLELDNICNYLSRNLSIHEILVSGGDPLLLKTPRLEQILDMLASVKNIEVIRIATRIPVTLPSRIDEKLVNTLAKYPGLWIVTHFNHPQEVTQEAINACNLIIKSGIPILNQTVLLKGINDNADILENLFRKLIKIKVKPHYLFHVDPVKGVKHFATGIDCGLDILREFRSKLSSIAVPHFAIDLPEGGGKVALQPDYTQNQGFISINNKTTIPYYQSTDEHR